MAKENADRDGVEIRSYNIIYDAIEEIEAAMRGMRAPKYRDVDTGTAEVREVYKISSAGTIAGSLVTSGNIRREGVEAGTPAAKLGIQPGDVLECYVVEEYRD